MDNKKYNKQLFAVEAVIGIAAVILTLSMIAIAAYIIEENTLVGALLIIIPIVCFVVICLGLTKMEQIVGFYQCAKCRHKYVPKYGTVLWSVHLGRTRYMTCPKCHEKSWQKKVLEK